MEATFGEYIRKLRTGKRMTLTQLAAKLDLDSANLSKIENGKREFDERRLEKLAETCGVHVSVIKTEFFSDLFARKICKSNCSIEVLAVAEEKVVFLKNKDFKQAQTKFDKEGNEV